MLKSILFYIAHEYEGKNYKSAIKTSLEALKFVMPYSIQQE
jgi:hypothetical protein